MTGRLSATCSAARFGPAICAAFLCMAFTPVTAAAQVGSLREALYARKAEGRRAATPPVARYVSETGASFTFDRTAAKPLLKFDGDPEVWALEPHAAPRGDVIYKNDLGQPVLRATKIGGLIVYDDAQPMGAAAAMTGAGAPIRLGPVSPNMLLRQLAAASAKASRAARRLISFEAQDVTSDSSALVADASLVAADAMVRLSREPNGKSVLATISKVVLRPGKKPRATLEGGVMNVTVAPELGLAGRPSSERIAYVAGAR